MDAHGVSASDQSGQHFDHATAGLATSRLNKLAAVLVACRPFTFVSLLQCS